MTCGCIRFIDSYRFLSSSLNNLVKTLVDNSHKTLKGLEEEIVGNDEILNVVKGTEGEDGTIKALKDFHPDTIEKIEEALLNYLCENDPKFLKTEFPDKWKNLIEKLAFPCEFFDSLDDYQNPVDKLKKEDIFSKSKNKYPDDEEIERTKQIFKLFNIKNRGELTQICLKSDVLLLTCVFEKFIKVPVNEFWYQSSSLCQVTWLYLAMWF